MADSTLTRVAIYSPNLQKYIGLNGDGIDKRQEDMYRDRASLSDSVGKLETFKLHHYPDGRVAFESSTPSVYLSANDGGVEVGTIEGAGMGYTGAQFGVKTSEVFRLLRQGDHTNVAPELGIGQRYLRCGRNSAGKALLNAQGGIASAEIFQIFVLP